MSEIQTSPVNMVTALSLVKSRLNRVPGDTSLDDMLNKRIEAAIQQLKDSGIDLQDTARDIMLVVDLTVWEYQNRDKPGGMPEWLRRMRFERWLESGVT